MPDLLFKAGGVIAIALGETPASSPDEIRLTSSRGVWTDARDDVTVSSAVRNGGTITVSLA